MTPLWRMFFTVCSLLSWHTQAFTVNSTGGPVNVSRAAELTCSSINVENIWLHWRGGGVLWVLEHGGPFMSNNRAWTLEKKRHALHRCFPFLAFSLEDTLVIYDSEESRSDLRRPSDGTTFIISKGAPEPRLRLSVGHLSVSMLCTCLEHAWGSLSYRTA